MLHLKVFKSFGLFAILTLAIPFPVNDAFANHEGVSHIVAGKTVYETTCVACHGANGKGTIPGVPDFTKKKSPLAKSDEELFTTVKEGFESPGSFMAMPPLGGNPDLTDQDVRDVIEYLREEFGKK